MSQASDTRIEHDLVGERELPNSAYYGVHTLRATENFPITDVPIYIYPDLVRALASVKKAAALTNHKVGVLSKEHCDAISAACDEIIAGKLHDQFVVDVIQGGAGTSTNMNANEVIANRALEIMGHNKGEYQHLHPNQHVNFGQSTNDVYPTALKIALWHNLTRLVGEIADLRDAFAAKAEEYQDILKIGRTQLQDAVPMTLGQEFQTYVTMLSSDERVLRDAQSHICEINLGGTAIGTGIASHPDYAQIVVKNLRDITGIPLVSAKDLISATQDCGGFVLVSGAIKRAATKLSKICNDLRLLSSGPRAGFNEINLPAVQAGSSIMPGKVNPVVPEVVSQVAFEVIGNDVAVTMAAEAGQLQLNAFEPIIAHSLFKSAKHLGAACRTLALNCVKGITVNTEHLQCTVNNAIGIVTALNPYIGYENATIVAQEAHRNGTSVYDEVLKRELMSREELDAVLKPETLTCPTPMNLKKG